MGGTSIFRQNYQKDAVKSTFTVSSCGDKSGLLNVAETAYANGNIEITTDLITRKIVQTNNVESYQGNNMSNTVGNDSIYTNGLNEGVYGSRVRIVGNPDIIYKELHKAADMKKAEIVAARSGFNDNRNSLDLNPISELTDMPGEVLDAVTSTPASVAYDENNSIPSSSDNLYANMSQYITNTINSMSSNLSKISASTQLKKAELVAKNKVERQKKQLENINSSPESGLKTRILEAIKNGNISAVFADPSNEDKEKTSIYNKEEYEAKVAEITPEMIQIERQC